LKGRGGAKRGIEGDIRQVVARGTRLDITSVLALGLGQRTPTRLFSSEFVEGGIQFARLEGLASLDLLPALPPVRVGACKNFLLGDGFGVALLGTFLLRLIFDS